MFFLHCWHNESVMNDQTKLAKSALLMAVRVSLVLSRTVERRGRGFRTLNRFKLYYSLPGMGLLQNTVTWYKKTPCWMASTQWEREKKGYMLFEWCNLFAFLSLCAVCHPARFFFCAMQAYKGPIFAPKRAYVMHVKAARESHETLPNTPEFGVCFPSYLLHYF